MSSYKDRNDRRIADEVTSEGKPAHLFCSAEGCPNLWSTTFDGNLCRWHSGIEPKYWPRITEELRALIADPRRQKAEKDLEPAKPPMTWAEKKAILDKLAALPAKWRAQDPKAWAFQFRDRETSGERLSENQRRMWRAALQNSMGAEA